MKPLTRLLVALAVSLPGSVAAAQQPSFFAIDETKFLASDGALFDQFGSSVAACGDVAVVGAPQHDLSGTAYVFVRTGTEWREQAKLTPSDGQCGDWFGRSVSVTRDAVLIGAPFSEEPCFSSGSAYVYVRTGTAWNQLAKLVPSDASCNASFGLSVSLAGNTALIGAFGDPAGGAFSGAAYVFERTGSVWVERSKLVPRDGELFDEFGWSVAVGKGVAVIGSPKDDDNGTDSGSAYVFVRAGSGWRQHSKLNAVNGAADDRFGWSVSLSEDTALIGALGNHVSGSAHAFVRAGSKWVEQAALASMGSGFGASVSLDGERAIVGAPLDDEKAVNAGSAYLFVRSGTSWGWPTKVTASDGGFNDQLARPSPFMGRRCWRGLPWTMTTVVVPGRPTRTSSFRFRPATVRARSTL